MTDLAPVAPISALDRSAPFYVAGHRGLVGGALWRALQGQVCTTLLGRSSTDLDLRDRDAVFSFFDEAGPAYVVVAAAKVGGILANDSYPADFISENLRIQVNVLDAAAQFGVERLLFLGSSCIYPRLAPQPIPEEALLTGALEPTNAAYAVAKIAGIAQVQALRKQHGTRFISAMPTNLYGPGDNFDLQTSHVLPALIRRFHEAAQRGNRSITLWGSGTPRREFLHVDDLAAACIFLMEHYDGDEPVNVGVGSDVTIRDLADLIASVTGFEGEIAWDTSKPDGTPRKLLDVSRLTALGWTASIPLEEGIRETYDWYRRELA